MNYATQHHIGHYRSPSANHANPTAPTIRWIRRLATEAKECQRNTKRQVESRADSYATDGFLKSAFLPKLQKTESVQAGRKSAKMESDFYKSLSQLAQHYGIEPMPSRQCGYPYNIALALDDIELQLRNNVRDWEQIHLIQDSEKTFLTSEERYSTGSTLYYIPILPLYRLSKNPKRKQVAELLQSVCAYLYHITDVPYYRQENSYLFWIYEMVTEWVACDDENEDTATYLAEITQAQWIGDNMERKIFNHQNLSRFRERLDKFKSKDSFDHDCFLLASEAFALYEQYPDIAFYRNAQPHTVAEEDDFENIVLMYKYVSFCAEAKGLLFQTLFDSVNNELQEYGLMQEPIIEKRFNGATVTCDTLDFENRLFSLIEELIYVLNSF
ncbi:hypothetical protein [Flavobacterium coralii]|uniref:hypothetical protein n=1 Tax=Flavobacterium coralii TaxID=2838017 RepID=UPI000C640149|nr:hypothetical protein [Flavobacterium sp.]|tara:strand:+ start:45220 stop:46374 length:1155 start_codon:yes stop_codon:yes gene_type:complete